MPFRIVRNDITKMHVDAIVNTANEEPIYSNGTDTAVYEAAGAEELLMERRKIGFLEEGEVAITPGLKLPVKYIIHAVSPIYYDGTCGEEEKLRSCYEKSLQLALEYGCESIAFPLIATGSYGYPKEEGLQIAFSVIHNFLLKEDMMIYLVVFDQEAVRLSGKIYDDIEAFIDENYVEEKLEYEYNFGLLHEVSIEIDELVGFDSNDYNVEKDIYDESNYDESYLEDDIFIERKNQTPRFQRKTLDFEKDMEEEKSVSISDYKSVSSPLPSKRSIEDILAHVSETFQQQLFRLIDERGLDDVFVYKRANVDKRLFHKIKCNEDYQPSKHTVVSFALALELNLDETKDLLARAGYALSPSNKYDLIIRYFIEHEIYDIEKINCALFDYEQTKLFGC